MIILWNTVIGWALSWLQGSCSYRHLWEAVCKWQRACGPNIEVAKGLEHALWPLYNCDKDYLHEVIDWEWHLTTHCCSQSAKGVDSLTCPLQKLEKTAYRNLICLSLDKTIVASISVQKLFMILSWWTNLQKIACWRCFWLQERSYWAQDGSERDGSQALSNVGILYPHSSPWTQEPAVRQLCSR